VMATILVIGTSRAADQPEASTGKSESPPPSAPDVLMIAVDDLNDWIGCLGGYAGTVHTPQIDRLAERGTLFTNAHCGAPVCNPSRTALMTGLRPSTSGVYHNGQWWRVNLPDVVTLNQHFRAHGYQTLGGGKIYHHTLGNNPPDEWNHFQPQVHDNPWHYLCPVAGQTVIKSGVRWPTGFPLNGIDAVAQGRRPPINYREFDWGPFDRDDLEMGDGQVVRWAMETIGRERTDSRPRFLAVGIFRPHLSWYAPRKHFERYELDDIVLPPRKPDDLNDVPPAGRKMAGQRNVDFDLILREDRYREAVRAYLASISFADALVGRLVDALQASGRANQTIILLWSDHGWHLGEKETWHKMTLWRRATRVPLIVVAPGVTPLGSRCDRPVDLLDLYPTLVDLCGLPAPPQQLDGMSLVPLLKDPGARRDRPALTTYQRGNHAVSGERFRLIHYADGSEELYDITEDPHEWTNLAGNPDYDKARNGLAEWLPKSDAPNAPSKGAFRFDPVTYTWQRRGEKESK
jgi:arylsulfatase A-like enzyme